MADYIYTGVHFFCQKIFIESTGDKEIDKAIKSTFKDEYKKAAPLTMIRDDVQITLAWRNKKLGINNNGKEAKRLQV